MCAKKVGLIDVDSHNFPNLALMKISAWHKVQGDAVDWWIGFEQYEKVYMSKVFTSEYTPDIPDPFNAAEIIKGGTGYGLDNSLPHEIEQIYPDYSLYPKLTTDTAFGFLTRGCPRACEFCIVASKEGRCAVKVANLSVFWSGQKYIKLLDPNLLACVEHLELLNQLAESKAQVDFTQGLDIRFINKDNVVLLNKIKTKALHFAWDNPKQDLVPYFQGFLQKSTIRDPRKLVVYVLTNFYSTHAEDLWRIYTLRDIGYTPYVMIFNKSTAPRETRLLQRWCNNRLIFRTQPDFTKYDPKMG